MRWSMREVSQSRTNEERSVQNDGRRVVITGVGAVTPIGTGADGLWTGLAARTSAVREITRFDPAPFRSRIAAEIPDFRPQDRSEEHTSELQSPDHLVCRLLLEKKKKNKID